MLFFRTYRRRPSAATVIACLALFMSLGGTAFAAIVITGANVKDGSLATKDIKDRSLLARDFALGQLPRGARGPAGPAGAAGATGASGAPGATGASGTRTVSAFTDAGDGATAGNATPSSWTLAESPVFTQPAGGHLLVVATARATFPVGCEGGSANLRVVVDGDELLDAGHYAFTGDGGKSFWVSASGALPPASSPTSRVLTANIRDAFPGCDVTFSSLSMRTYLLG